MTDQTLKTTPLNAAHRALADLEEWLGDNFLLVTQNIDNLHERAGSKRVLHMHGELLKVRCTQSGQVFEWHWRTMMQPIATRLSVPMPNSSAPSIAAMTMSRPVRIPPSARRRTRSSTAGCRRRSRARG